MSEHAYYEIPRWSFSAIGLNIMVMPGNMIFNRRHWQNGIEVLYPVKGTLDVKIEDAEYSLSEGDLITIDSGLLHEVSSGKPDYIQMIFSVDEKLMRREHGGKIQLSTVGEHALSREDPDILAVRLAIAALTEISTSFSEGGTYSDEAWYTAQIELNRILMIFSRHMYPAKPGNRTATPDFIKLVSTIHRNYGKNLNVTTLAKELGYSASTIFRLTRESTGMSFRHYLNSVRISMACGMLLESNKSVAEVAGACGFPSSSNFYRVFKLLNGITPAAYQQHAGNRLKAGVDFQDEILRYNIYQSITELPHSLPEILSIIRGEAV